MKAIIIEDEELAAERLAELIKEIDPAIEIVGTAGSVKSSIALLREVDADIVFMDIQLSDGVSFSIFDSVDVKTPIIFTTAYDQYAIKAFKYHSVDYLLKPVKKRELIESLKKFREIKNFQSEKIKELLLSFSSAVSKPEYKERFLIQFGEKIRKVEIDEAAYFVAIEKGTFLFTFSGQSYPIDYALEKLNESLDPKNFFRINRKIIVSYKSIAKIIPYSRSRVKLDLSPPLPKDIEAIVSVDRSRDFKDWLDK